MATSHTLAQLLPSCSQYPIPAVELRSGPYAVHVLQSVPAGFPSPAADFTEEALDLNRYLAPRTFCSFFFDVVGRSMEGAGIFAGDKVCVDRSINAQPGHIVVAIVNGDFTLKRLRLVGDRYELHSENPDFKPIRFQDGEELQVFGVVTAVIRKLM